MINTSIIKLFPCLLLKEDEEEEHTEGDRDNVHSFTQEPEPDRSLKVYAKGNDRTIGDERSMHPAKAIGKAYGYPSYKTE